MQPSDPLRTKTKGTAGIEDVRASRRARTYIELADRYLDSIGYTEHGLRHVNIVSGTAESLLRDLSFGERDVELAAVAGFLHDIGNMAGRDNHHSIGAVLAKEVLEELGFPFDDIGRVMAAVVTHEEDEEVVKYDPVSAALIIADKADVHRSRVRARSDISGDIHDRVNYAATHSEVAIDPGHKTITLSLTIDTRISQVMEYFEIFLTRMASCRKAARALGCEFRLLINESRMA